MLPQADSKQKSGSGHAGLNPAEEEEKGCDAADRQTHKATSSFRAQVREALHWL